MGTEVESPNSNNRVSQIITDSFLFLEGEEDGSVNGNATVDLPSPGDLPLPPPDIPATKCFISPNGNTCDSNQENKVKSVSEEDERTRVGGSEGVVGVGCDGSGGEYAASGNAGHLSKEHSDLKEETKLSVSERIERLEKLKLCGDSCTPLPVSVVAGGDKATSATHDIKDNCCDNYIQLDTHIQTDCVQEDGSKKISNDGIEIIHQKSPTQGHTKVNQDVRPEQTQGQAEVKPVVSEELRKKVSNNDIETHQKSPTQGHTKVNQDQGDVNPEQTQGQPGVKSLVSEELSQNVTNQDYEIKLQEHAHYIVSKVLNSISLREALDKSESLVNSNQQTVQPEVTRPTDLKIFENNLQEDDKISPSQAESESVKDNSVTSDITNTSPSKSHEEASRDSTLSELSPAVSTEERSDNPLETPPKNTVILRRKKSSVSKDGGGGHEGGSGSCDSDNSSPCQSPATRRRHVLRSPVLRLKQEWNSVDMGSDLDSPRQSEDSEDDDDAGIYAESYRNSQWLYLGEVPGSSSDVLDVDTDVSRTSSNSASSGFDTTTETSFGDIDVITNDVTDDVEIAETSSKENLNVSVDSGLGQLDVASPRLYKQRVQYDDLPPTLPRRSKHVRSESISTTASEIEFRKRYQAKTRRIVQRKSNTQTYQRMSERFYDDERCMAIEKREGDRTFGFHIKSCRPVMVSTVEAGSAAEAAGVRVGDSVIAVNDVNVLEVSHEEAIRLISQNCQKVKLTVAADNKLHTDLPLCIGFLNKQGGSGILKNWRRRWFILKQDHCLYYYKTDEDKDPLGAILLTNFTISKAPEANRKYTFKAHKYGQRTYYFQADTEDEMNNWASALSNAAKTTTKTDTWLDVSSHNVGLPALSIKCPDCHGHLTKMGNRRKNWKRRYCVLKDACLYYYIDLTSSTAQGVAHLHGYKVEDGLPYTKKFGFTLQPPDPTMRTFYFFADNETDMRRWINALQKSIGKWVRADD